MQRAAGLFSERRMPIFSAMLRNLILFQFVFQLRWLVAVAAAATTPLPSLNASCQSPLFVFGASIVDVGENVVAMPFRSLAAFPPYAMDYFSRPNGRFSNGRNFIDFVSQQLGHGLLNPFLKSVGQNFIHGVNFASAGSTAQDSSLLGDGSDSAGLFSLMVQVDQFREFKTEVEDAIRNKDSLQDLPSIQQFSEAIYFIETAHNDYLRVPFETLKLDPLVTLSATMSAIEKAIKDLYNLGARNIIMMNLTPLGCAPSLLSNEAIQSEYDECGCKLVFNNILSLHNKHLEQLLETLQTQLPLSNLVVFDAYSIMLDGYCNPSKYGIKYPHQACCGAGGKYKYLQSIQCGRSGYVDGKLVEAKRCEDPSLHLIWDSIHPVESFCHHIADGFFSGRYFKPDINLADLCKSDYFTS
eukprot:c47258_g1_i1 orf=287-1522(+)